MKIQAPWDLQEQFQQGQWKGSVSKDSPDEDRSSFGGKTHQALMATSAMPGKAEGSGSIHREGWHHPEVPPPSLSVQLGSLAPATAQHTHLEDVFCLLAVVIHDLGGDGLVRAQRSAKVQWLLWLANRGFQDQLVVA